MLGCVWSILTDDSEVHSGSIIPALMMEAVRTFETSVVYQTTQQNFLEEVILIFAVRTWNLTVLKDVFVRL
jgi:hypothetical protein